MTGLLILTWLVIFALAYRLENLRIKQITTDAVVREVMKELKDRCIYIDEKEIEK